MRVDSKEGITELMRWAKASGTVLSEAHERVAKRHGVPTDGVVFARPLPVAPTPLT